MEGFLEINEKEYFFTFSEWILKIIPKNEVGYSISDLNDILQGKFKESIPNIIRGKSIGKENYVYFFVKKILMQGLNIGTYDIEIYAYISSPEANLSIDSIGIYNKELNWFYDISKAYRCSFTPDTGEVNIGVKSFDSLEKTSMFKYKGKDIQTTLNISRSISIMSENPICLRTELDLSFANTESPEFLLDIVNLVEKFLSFISYRKNVYIEEIQLKKLINKKLHHCGKLYIYRNRDSFNESEKVIKNQIINFELIQENYGNLFQLLSDETIYLDHVPYNSRDSKIITPSRFVLITAAFEWEFRHIYRNIKEIENENFKIVKHELKSFIDKKIEDTSGKKKNYFKKYLNIISNSDMSLSERIMRVLKDNEEILKPFINNLYNMNGINEIKHQDIANRIQTQRNNYAHGNIDKEIDLLVVLDLSVLEWCIYVLVLKEIGLEDDIVKKCINKLFNRRIALK